jgi:hypothetical protein
MLLGLFAAVRPSPVLQIRVVLTWWSNTREMYCSGYALFLSRQVAGRRRAADSFGDRARSWYVYP